MFQQMLNASRAILLRPSVAQFEEHERNDLGWAVIYTALSAVISAVLGAVGFAVRGPAMQESMRQLQDQMGGQPLPPFFNDFLLGGGGLTLTIVMTLVFGIGGFLIYMGIIYLLGRAFGGTGAFGELAYDVALFSGPLNVVSTLVSLLGIGPLACLTSLVSLALWAYGLYLSWLSVQAGMNLPGNKALWVILIPILVVVVLICGIIALAFLALLGATSTAP